jgi:hypothetical protein
MVPRYQKTSLVKVMVVAGLCNTYLYPQIAPNTFASNLFRFADLQVSSGCTLELTMHLAWAQCLRYSFEACDIDAGVCGVSSLKNTRAPL